MKGVTGKGAGGWDSNMSERSLIIRSFHPRLSILSCSRGAAGPNGF
jgi:hypothetical protein